MTQNPYGGGGFDDAIGEPPRTSVMAVLSLVFSLIGCCVPIGLLGSLLGVFALMGIGRSEGRVTGRGLAVAGIIVGLVTTGIWFGGYYALQQGTRAYAKMTGDVLADIEAGDYDAARGPFAASAAYTDEQFDAFHQAYTDELGAFQRTPAGFIEFIQMFLDPAVGPQMENYQGRNDMMPSPALFDQGNALVVFLYDPRQAGGGAPGFTDIVIVLGDGTEIKLSDAPAAEDGAAPPADPAGEPDEDPTPTPDDGG